MSRRLSECQLKYACFPRVSGDEPKSETFRNFIDGFSPRERG